MGAGGRTGLGTAMGHTAVDHCPSDHLHMFTQAEMRRSFAAFVATGSVNTTANTCASVCALPVVIFAHPHMSNGTPLPRPHTRARYPPLHPLA